MENGRNTNDKTVKVKSLSGYGSIREEIDEGSTLSVKTPVEQHTKPKTKVSIGIYLYIIMIYIYIYIYIFELWRF